MSYAAVDEGLRMCPNAGFVIKLGTCCAHEGDARLGDVVVMGSGKKKDRCLVDGDEKIEDEWITYSLYQYPHVDELLVMQATSVFNFPGAFIRLPYFSKSIPLNREDLPEGYVGEMETAGKWSPYWCLLCFCTTHSLTNFSSGVVDAVINRMGDRQLKVGSVNILSEVFSLDGVEKIKNHNEKLSFYLTHFPEFLSKVVACVSKADSSPRKRFKADPSRE